MKKKILIVEDEGIIALNYRMALQGKSFEITDSVTTGRRAIESVKASSPDLILMDIRLKGGMDGIEAADHILNGNKIPVIFLSGNSDPETRKRAMKIDYAGYFQKPVKMKSLINTINRLIL